MVSDFQLLLKNILAVQITKENVTEMSQDHSALRQQIKKYFYLDIITFIAWASDNRKQMNHFASWCWQYCFVQY